MRHIPRYFILMLILSMYHLSVFGFQSCNGFNSRLSLDDATRVTTNALNIRQNATTDAETLRDPLPSGTRLTIIDGPRCSNDILWWKVAAGQLEGWVAEGIDDDYFLSAPFDPNSVASNLNALLALLDLQPGAGERFLTCEGGFYEDNGLTGRIAFSDNNVPNGGTVRVIPTTQVLEVDYPAICVSYKASVNGRPTAIAPDGRQYDALIYIYEQRDAGNSWQASLPPIAYLQGGRWQLRAGNFTLNVEINRSNNPYAFYTYADNGRMYVGGLQPNEAFVISGRARSNDDLSYIEAEANTNGTYQLALNRVPWVRDLEPNMLYRSVVSIDIVGQFGSVYMYEGVAITDPRQDNRLKYQIPMPYAASIVYDTVWGNLSTSEIQNIRDSWTCPGGSPIRLSAADLNAEAIVLNNVGRQNIYDQPNTSSSVERTLDPGRTISILRGVECNNQGVWWRTNSGWIMESQNGRYLLGPN